MLANTYGFLIQMCHLFHVNGDVENITLFLLDRLSVVEITLRPSPLVESEPKKIM